MGQQFPRISAKKPLIPRTFLSGAAIGGIGGALLMLFSSTLSGANYLLTRRQTVAIERMAAAFEHGAVAQGAPDMRIAPEGELLVLPAPTPTPKEDNLWNL